VARFGFSRAFSPPFSECNSYLRRVFLILVFFLNLLPSLINPGRKESLGARIQWLLPPSVFWRGSFPPFYSPNEPGSIVFETVPDQPLYSPSRATSTSLFLVALLRQNGPNPKKNSSNIFYDRAFSSSQERHNSKTAPVMGHYPF